MYDFYFGNKKEIKENEDLYLVSIKRMLPKWMNSIPDSEFIALGNIAKLIKSKNPILVETGSGSSSLILCFYAMKNNGILYSWDTNPEKTSQLRSAFNETIARYFDKDINKHWVTVNSLSTSKYCGLDMLRELEFKVDLFFHDSDHVLNTITEEINLMTNIMRKNSFICIDDANYRFKNINTGYANIIRKKIGLKKIKEKNENLSDYFYKEVDLLLKKNFKKVLKIKDTYKKNFKNDIYFKYFNKELEIKSEMKMENLDKLEHRFDAWKLVK